MERKLRNEEVEKSGRESGRKRRSMRGKENIRIAREEEVVSEFQAVSR
jgi:hypothetical protein